MHLLVLKVERPLLGRETFIQVLRTKWQVKEEIYLLTNDVIFNNRTAILVFLTGHLKGIARAFAWY